jgi:hypothetical protein
MNAGGTSQGRRGLAGAWKGPRLRFLVFFGSGVAVLLVLVGLFSYLMLPGLIESRLAANLKERYELEQEPEVEVFSNFPPELLLGRIDRIEVRIDQPAPGGILLPDLHVNLEGVSVPIRSLWRGDLERELPMGLVVEVPEESISEYLQENVLDPESRK